MNKATVYYTDGAYSIIYYKMLHFCGERNLVVFQQEGKNRIIINMAQTRKIELDEENDHKQESDGIFGTNL